MIRRYLHRRWLGRFSLEAIDWELDHWRWIDRYCDWSVATFGETPGNQPWWDVWLGRFTSWLADWRGTLALRMSPDVGLTSDEVLRILRGES